MTNQKNQALTARDHRASREADQKYLRSQGRDVQYWIETGVIRKMEGTQKMDESDAEAKVPTNYGRIQTKAVQKTAGWVGVVTVDDVIVLETEPTEEAADAKQQAKKAVADGFAKLFGA